MHLTHKIALDPTFKQAAYFRRAAGTARFVYNWGLAEWNRQYAAGEKPTGYGLNGQFNAIYKAQFPWIGETHRDCHQRPFTDLQAAHVNFFKKTADKPVFKKRGKNRNSFYLANDVFTVNGKTVRLPRIGHVRMREALRFTGKIIAARCVEECGRWFICISMDVGEIKRERTGTDIVGVDLGITALATLSTGEKIYSPRPLRRAQKRLRRANRKLHRRVKGSNNRNKQRQVLAKAHRRIRNIHHDCLHKLTSRLCKNHAVVVIEDLNVQGMVKNHSLAQSISDASFGMFRQFLCYKAPLHGTQVIVADRFYPSSKTCSSCGLVKDKLSLRERIFECDGCDLKICRDLNAALNLRSLGQALPEVTPVESLWSDDEAGTTLELDLCQLTK